MIMKRVLQFFIIVFLAMVVVGLLRGKGRTKARSYETVRESKKVAQQRDMAERYEQNPDEAGMTEDDYLYSCFVTDREYNGYNLKNAVAFHTTCDIRGVNDENGRKNLLRMEDVFGKIENIEEFNVEEFYLLGERMSNIVAARKRLEKAE